MPVSPYTRLNRGRGCDGVFEFYSRSRFSKRVNSGVGTAQRARSSAVARGLSGAGGRVRTRWDDPAPAPQGTWLMNRLSTRFGSRYQFKRPLSMQRSMQGRPRAMLSGCEKGLPDGCRSRATE
jgi:hypothetical protein